MDAARREFLCTQKLAGHPPPLPFPTPSFPYPFLSLHTPGTTDRQSSSIRHISGDRHRHSFQLLDPRHPIQFGSHCAPRRHPHPVEHISCSSLDIRAETAMTHRLYYILHDAQRRTRSNPITQSSMLFPKLLPLASSNPPLSHL